MKAARQAVPTLRDALADIYQRPISLAPAGMASAPARPDVRPALYAELERAQKLNLDRSILDRIRPELLDAEARAAIARPSSASVWPAGVPIEPVTPA